MNRTYNILFLCTGNASRSIMAEAILNHRSQPNFHAYSAGSQPRGQVHPGAIQQLESASLPTAGLRSKSWNEFAEPGAPKMDFIFTLCDDAAREVCPVWPGHPVTAHWGVPDPGNVQGSPEDKVHAFRDAYFALERRIELFLSLPLASLEGLALQNELDGIGKR